MGKRPLSQSLRHWLLDEVDLWRNTGLVSDEQADAILDLYETPQQSSARQQSIAIYILVGLAASFVGLAMLLCIGYNWQSLHDAVKLALILAAVGGAHALGFALRYVWRARIFSEFAFFLGCLLYGGAIGLIADIFKLGDHPPDGVWWWAIGVVPLALFLDTIVLHLLVVALLATWVGMELLGEWRLVFQPFEPLPHACWTLPIFAALGLIWAYRKKSPIAVALYVPLATWWFVLLPFAWGLRENPIFFIGGVGAVLLIAAEVHADGSRFAIPYRLYGALLCMAVLSILSFIDMQRDLVQPQNVVPFLVHSIAIALLSGAVFGVAIAVQRRRSTMSYERPMFAFAVRQWLPLSMAALMVAMALWYAALNNIGRERDEMIAVVPTIAANLGMLALSFWLLMFGLREERGVPAAAGGAFFLLWTIFRYAEWFGDRGGMLGASCMFFLCGAAIFTIAMFWHHRKKRARSRYEPERE
jgi:uncharacterized membrane protein